jgi:type II secretory pathway pseudopilin PulG
MRGDSGAVFVESIIAAAIVAMALGATLQVVADSAGRDRSAEAHRTALLVAQSELDEVGVNIPLETGRTFGEADEMAWRVDVSPYAAEGEPNSAGALWKVAVSVRSRHGGPDLVSLETLRLGGGS